MTSKRQSTNEEISTSAPPPSQQFRNPFPTSTRSHDPDAIFHHESEKWHFSGHRKASAPATDVVENARHTSEDDQRMYEEIMRDTKDLNQEQVREYLKKRPSIDGARIIRGRKGDGYLGLTGPFSGTM